MSTATLKEKTRLAALYASMRSQGWEPGHVDEWNAELTEKNYHALMNSGTKGKNLPLACAAVELLAAHQPDTVRGVMYLVVSRGWLPDTSDKSYDRVQRLLNRLREKGTIPFQWVVDTVRSTIKPTSWSGLADYVETVQDAYRKNFWASLSTYVEVIVEKDTVAGKLSVVTRAYDVPMHPIRGYSSTSYAWSIAQGWQDITKPIHVYYIGDHDPSGRDLERNIREKLTCYSKKQFRWVRLGVNPEHFDKYDILPLAPKKRDSRYRKFAEQWGERCAEVEAIPATELRAMLTEAIESHIPAGEWERLQEIEQLERESWQAAVATFKSAGEGRHG